MEEPGLLVDPIELRHLLDNNRPASVLHLVPDQVQPELAIYRAEALIELDRYQHALELLEGITNQLEGDCQARAWCLQAQVLVRYGRPDSAVLLANRAVQSTLTPELQAEAYAAITLGYAAKRCWRLSELNLHKALGMAPAHPRVLASQARLYLESDRRVEARSIYENLEKLPPKWAKTYAAWGKSYVAYLMGEFDEADSIASSALTQSHEVISLLYVLAQVALARNDLDRLIEISGEIKRRSPEAEGLEWYQAELEKLHKRLVPTVQGSSRRLAAFPTTIQRRNYCGPSTVELVLRYWQADPSLTSEKIADKIKFSISGTPLYRMREFFHLVGFDSIRCQAPMSVLQKIIDAGFPVVVQEEYSSSSHVAVVIGYDLGNGSIELQDPMTHVVTTIPIENLNQLRRSFLDSALVAFPRGQDHEKTLARLNIYNDLAFVWTDQAVLELEGGQYQEAADLLEKAIRRKPNLSLAWMLLLHAYLEEWRRLQAIDLSPGKDKQYADGVREKFYAVLQRARRRQPDAKFIHQFAGWGALADHDYERALEGFRRACSLDSEDARNHASLAECYYGLRDYQSAVDAAWESLHCDPSSPSANIWLARSLAALGDERAYHFAQAAVDLDYDNWLAHLALAEANLDQNNVVSAHQEADIAFSIAPSLPETRLMSTIIQSLEGNSREAERQILEILAVPGNLSPSTLFRAHQTLGKLYFNNAQYHRAAAIAYQLLDAYPEDPWALKFLASARCEELVVADTPVDPTVLSEVVNLYETAVRANHGAALIIREFITYLEALTDSSTLLHELQKLQSEYPENQALHFLFGRLYRQLGDEAAAAQAMLMAIDNNGGLQTSEYLVEAVQTVIFALVVTQGTERILSISNDKGIPSLEIQRTLGLILSTLPEVGGKEARELLLQVLKNEPMDVEVILALGHVVQTDLEQENLYRQALMLSPSWWYARLNLAAFLVEHGRSAEALEFTRGHEHSSSEMMVVHGRALLGAGHYEEAVDVFSHAIHNSEQPDTWLYTWLWQAELRSGRHNHALRTARRGQALFPQDTLWYFHLADSLRSLNRFDEANRIVRHGVARGLNRAEVLRAEYETAIAQQEPETALALLDQFDSIQDQSAAGSLSWSEAQRFCLLVEAGRVEESLALIRSADLNANGWGEAAWIAVSANDPRLALDLAQRALSLDPNIYYGLLVNAQVLTDTGKFPEAILAWYALRDAFPNQHDAYEKLAVLIGLEGQVDQGMALAEQAVHLGTFCPEAWAVRGLVGFFKGNQEEAFQDLTISWNRMDMQRRNKAHVYWYLLSFLRRDEDGMQRNWEMVNTHIQTPLQQRILKALQLRIAV